MAQIAHERTLSVSSQQSHYFTLNAMTVINANQNNKAKQGVQKKWNLRIPVENVK